MHTVLCVSLALEYWTKVARELWIWTYFESLQLLLCQRLLVKVDRGKRSLEATDWHSPSASVCVWEESWYRYVGCKSRNVMCIPCLEIIPCSGKWTAMSHSRCNTVTVHSKYCSQHKCWFMHTLINCSSADVHHTFTYCMLYLHSEWGVVQTNVTVLPHLQTNTTWLAVVLQTRIISRIVPS